jgi:hypothetical protein
LGCVSCCSWHYFDAVNQLNQVLFRGR